MKKSIVILLVLFVMLGAFAATMPSDSVISDSATKLGVPFAELKNFVSQYYVVETSTEVLKVDFLKLAKEVQENELKAKRDYVGKTVEGTIKIYSVDDSNGEIMITIWDESFGNIKFPVMSCYIYLKSSEVYKAYNLVTGQRIKVRGVVEEGFLGFDIRETVIL
ncbi:MAG: hypothetical protein ACI4M4_04525 [Candidatus Ornithospirochaeta sp.]